MKPNGKIHNFTILVPPLHLQSALSNPRSFKKMLVHTNSYNTYIHISKYLYIDSMNIENHF